MRITYLCECNIENWEQFRKFSNLFEWIYAKIHSTSMGPETELCALQQGHRKQSINLLNARTRESVECRWKMRFLFCRVVNKCGADTVHTHTQSISVRTCAEKPFKTSQLNEIRTNGANAQAVYEDMRHDNGQMLVQFINFSTKIYSMTITVLLLSGFAYFVRPKRFILKCGGCRRNALLCVSVPCIGDRTMVKCADVWTIYNNELK